MSPTIITAIKSSYEKKNFLVAAKSELSQLQFQLSLTGMLLAQRFGSLNKSYLEDTKKVLIKYEGSEKPDSMIKFIDSMLVATEEEFKEISAHLRAEDGVGLSLKTHTTILIDSNAVQIGRFPIDLQSKIYEFKNALNIFNQEVLAAQGNLELTYDSSLTSENHDRLKAGLNSRYSDLQGICVRTVDKIQDILDFEL